MELAHLLQARAGIWSRLHTYCVLGISEAETQLLSRSAHSSSALCHISRASHLQSFPSAIPSAGNNAFTPRHWVLTAVMKQDAILLFSFWYLFTYSAVLSLSCGTWDPPPLCGSVQTLSMWDRVPQPGTEPGPSTPTLTTLGARCPSPWTTRDVSKQVLFLTPFHSWGNWDSERPSGLPKAITAGKRQSLGAECNQPSSRVHTISLRRNRFWNFLSPAELFPKSPAPCLCLTPWLWSGQGTHLPLPDPIPLMSGRDSLCPGPCPLPLLSHINPTEPRSFSHRCCWYAVISPTCFQTLPFLEPKGRAELLFFLQWNSHNMKFTVLK